MTEKRRAKSSKDSDTKRRKLEDGSASKFQGILDQVRALQDGQVALPFLKLPSKKLYPDYYKEISDPISLAEIEDNLSEYATGADFLAAFTLMLDNAVAYNGLDSEIAQGAKKINNFVEDQVEHTDDEIVQELQGEDGEEEEDENEDEDEGDGEEDDEDEDDEEQDSGEGNVFHEFQLELKAQEQQTIEQLKNYKVRGRKIAEIFFDEPSKELYPHYYEVVENATSFNKVLKQLNTDDRANTLEGFAELVQLIFDNAKLFNEENSQVYLDAVTLEKQFHSRLDRLRTALDQPEGYEEWLAGEGEDDEDEEGEDEEDEEEPSEEAIREERLKHVVEEERHRAPGKTAADGLINSVILSSMVPSTNAQQRFMQGRLSNGLTAGAPTTNPSMSNLFKLAFPASRTHTVRSFATELPTYHHTVNVSVVMHESLHNRFYHLMVHHNSTRRIVPVSSSTTNPWNDITKPLTDRFEIRLQPGLNKIEVVLQAGPIQRGPVRHVTQQLPVDGREEEKYILWVMLGKSVTP